MSPRKALGYSLFAAPVIALYVFMALVSGLAVALKIAAITAACLLFIAACIVGGSKLVDEGKPE